MKRWRNNRGIALVLVLFVMIILLIITMTLSSMATTDNQIAMKHFYSRKAFNLARSGLIRARAELRGNSDWGRSSVSHSFGKDGEDGSYTVTVGLQQSAEGESFWRVTSVGQIGQYKRTILSWLELESFSKYMYMTNTEEGRVNGQNVTIWFANNDKLNGPVHTNGYFNVYRNPQFGNTVTSNNSGDSYYNSNNRTYRQGGVTTTDPSRFYHYYSNYRQDVPTALDGTPDFSFTGGIPAAEFPTTLSTVQTNADYTVDGDVDWISFSANGTVTVKPSSGSAVTLNTQNITIYVDGSINSIYGTVNGKATVAAKEDIIIKDNITYANDEVDMLGIVAEEDVIVETNANTQRNLTVQASIMAVNGSFYVDDYDKGRYRGYLNIFGSLVQNRRGPVGTFSSTNSSTSTGYNKNYSYDERLKFLRPPNFPTTGKFAIKSFRDLGALGGD